MRRRGGEGRGWGCSHLYAVEDKVVELIPFWSRYLIPYLASPAVSGVTARRAAPSTATRADARDRATFSPASQGAVRIGNLTYANATQ